jgi:beta-galactosidase
MLKLITLCLIGTIALSFSNTSVRATSRTTLSFDAGWFFFKGDASGAENPSFNDSAWRKLDVPHDWSIEGPFDKNNPTRGSGGFLPSGVGWYRKHFTLDSKNKRVFIEFDGVMTNSDVWINGFHLGKRPYGYVSFRYELTDHLKLGGENVLAVRVDTSAQPASRWYSGAGIYRHTRLVTTEPVHIEHWATFITTPQVSAEKATVLVRTTVINQSEVARNVALEITLIDANGRALKTPVTSSQSIAPGKSDDFQQEIVVKNPLIWDKDHPYLYKAITRARADNSNLDEETTTFGVREFHFDPVTGFWLNGRNFKLKGVCLHHDGSAFGAAVPLRAWERRLEILKGLGVNAIRTAHNPPSPEFLDLCDRMGFLVMDEMFDCWTVGKNSYDYHLYFKEWSLIDTRDTVRRDRNHPSVILYSAGNEIHDTPKPEIAIPILSSLVKVFHENDDSRPVTQALFRPNVSHDYDNGLADLLDVVGQNYRENEILAANKQKPTRKIVGTENTHELNAWLPMRDNPQYAGQFIWTGIDYLGESPAWPNIASNFGLLDRTGTVRPIGYQRASWWSDKPMLYIARRVAPTPLAPTDPGYSPIPDRRPQVLFSDWTPRNLSVHEENVEVYSNCDEVELFLNGVSIGTQSRHGDDSPRIWKVQYASGTLLAVGRNNVIKGDEPKGVALLEPQTSSAANSKNKVHVVATYELRTAVTPAKIILTADRNSLGSTWDDIVYVSATVVDANGVLIPTASDLITFKVSGPGVIAAVDSGNNTSHEPFQASERKAYQGRCFAIIKASSGKGRITLSASAPGLKESSVSIVARK